MCTLDTLINTIDIVITIPVVAFSIIKSVTCTLIYIYTRIIKNIFNKMKEDAGMSKSMQTRLGS